MQSDIDLNEVELIKEWISTVDYLPQNIDDIVIKKFIHCNYSDLEATKKCIDKFCTKRRDMPEVYTDRDPLSEKLKTAYSISRMAFYEAEDTEILIHQLHLPNKELFNCYDILKVMSINSDYWMKLNPFIPERHILIIDAKDFTFGLVRKINLLFYRSYLMYLLECLPVRLKHVHIFNLRIFSERIYGFFKAVLPTRICELISFHPNMESLQNAVGKQHLPVEYGGDAPSFIGKHEHWVKKVEELREMFTDDSLWKAKKKGATKNVPSENEDEPLSVVLSNLNID